MEDIVFVRDAGPALSNRCLSHSEVHPSMFMKVVVSLSNLVWPVIYSFNKYLWTTYHVPGTMKGMGHVTGHTKVAPTFRSSELTV